MYWRRIWRAPSGRSWRIWSWKGFWSRWVSCCWSSTCTGRASRWAAMTRLWCASGSAYSRSWSAPTSASSTSTAIPPNLASSCTRTSSTPAALTPWAGWTRSGGLEAWESVCNKSEHKLSPALIWPDLSADLKSLLLLILLPCNDLSRAAGQSNVLRRLGVLPHSGCRSALRVALTPSSWSHLSLAHSQILDDLFLDYHRSAQAQRPQRPPLLNRPPIKGNVYTALKVVGWMKDPASLTASQACRELLETERTSRGKWVIKGKKKKRWDRPREEQNCSWTFDTTAAKKCVNYVKKATSLNLFCVFAWHVREDAWENVRKKWSQIYFFLAYWEFPGL